MRRPRTPVTAAEAGYFDIADWGDKDVSGAYAPGTVLDLGDGVQISLDDLPDHIGGRDERPPERPG